MKILIDNGHGQETAGKRSPDGLLREYAYAREIADRVVFLLRRKGYDAERIVKEETDVKLSERCRRVNKYCKKLGKENVLVVSIHCNASGNGDWKEARGWEAYTYVGQSESDVLAEELYKVAKEVLSGHKIRTDHSDGDCDKESNFYILKHTSCAAVLTENLFQDNREDVKFLLSEKGKQAISRIHVDGIINYISSR